MKIALLCVFTIYADLKRFMSVIVTIVCKTLYSLEKHVFYDQTLC